jgi:predicted nucleotidyltransferase
MHPIDLNYISHEIRGIEEMELRVETLKEEKKSYVKKLEKRFRKSCSLEEAQRRLKDYLDRNPRGEEMKKLKAMDSTLHHVIKRLDIKKEKLEKFHNERRPEGSSNS